MPFGLVLTRTRTDEALLAAVCERCPSALEADWWAGGDVVGSDVLDASVADALKRGGFGVVEVAERGQRRVSGLLEAVRPVPGPLVLPDEVLFGVDAADPAAGRLLTALVVLERGDTRISEVDGLLLARVANPPVYLLHRARDEGGVTAYARTGQHLYVVWGLRHPLDGLLDAQLGRRGQIGLCAADGTLVRLEAGFPSRAIHDALRAELPHRNVVLVPVPGAHTFPVQVRLGNSDPTDAELFLLEPADLEKLEGFVDGASPDDTARLLLSRLADPSGRPRYVLREALRPQQARLGPQIASLLRMTGYSRASGFDALYLPVGRRLVPTLRRDDTRALLGLDDGVGAVIVDQDADGIHVIRVAGLEDTPLSRLVTFLALDRRVELDRLYEEALLSFPRVEIERPAKAPVTVVDPPAVRERVPVAPRPIRPPPAPRVDQTPETAVERDLAALRLAAEAQEEHVLGAAVDDGPAWRELGRLHVAIGDPESAVHDLGAAVFLDDEAAVDDLDDLAIGSVPAERRSDALLEVVVLDWPTNDQVVRAAALVLAALRSGGVDDALGHAVERLFLRPDLPIARRLQWTVLRQLARSSRDDIGLVRAKEALLGALNARGLTETLDLPRFVRHRLAATTDGPDDEATPSRAARGEQLTRLERLFVRIVPQPLEMSDARDAMFRVIFAVGLSRLGGSVAELVRSVEYEAEAHETPVVALLRLYLARRTFLVTGGSDEAWKAEVTRTIAGLSQAEDRRVVGWFVQRSAWLRTDGPAEPGGGLAPAVARALRVESLPHAADQLLETGCFDVDVARGGERLIDLALATGRDEVIVAVARRLHQGAAGLRILAPRARVIGACLRAAATVGDAALVERCLDDAGAIAGDPSVPSVRDLLVAVRPALAALRRVGAGDAARRFLGAFAAVTEQPGKEAGPLCAAVALGYLQLGEEGEAATLRDRGFERVWARSTPHVDRYEAGAALLDVLRHWPLGERTRICDEIAGRLTRFADTFTTRRYFPVHEVWIAERLVECLVDAGAARSDRVQGWLDVEEARVRRRVLADCRKGTG